MVTLSRSSNEANGVKDLPIIGNNSATLVMPTLDTSALSAYYASGVSLGQAALAAKIENELLKGSYADLGDSVIPPWMLPDVAARSGQDALQNIFNTTALIDFDDPRASGTGDDENFKNMFALYTALGRMQEMTSFASTSSLATSYAGLMQSKFEGYLGEIKDFVSGLSIDNATLLYGSKIDTIASTIEFPETLDTSFGYHTGTSISSVRADAIAGLSGTETFDIEATNTSGTTTVSIDLSAVSGTLNVDNIVSYINGELAAAGVGASIAVERFDENNYGFEFNMISGETIALKNATGAEESVYIAGSSGASTYGSGFLKKLDDLAAASPTEVFRENIDNVDEADDAKAVAVDSQGYTYVVGTTTGDMDAQLNQGSSDAYLRKYDAAGNEVWTRMLGATESATGFAVTVDASDNVIIAGQVQGTLTPTSYGGGYDSFVSKYDSSGAEQWTRQAAPYANDGALALTTDASGNIFIAGHTSGAIDINATHSGGTDGYITRLDSSGTAVWSTQFGGTGDDLATAIEVDASGNVFITAENGGNAVVRKYSDDGSAATLTYETDLGALNSGDTATGLTLDGSGGVYVSGNTTNAALNGTIVTAHAGGTDGFVTKLTDAGASASIDFTTYIGDTGDDTVNDIAVNAAGDIFVTGGTATALDGGGDAASQDFYARKLDSAGATVWTQQYRSTYSQTGNSIVIDDDGTDVLSKLGLPTGDLASEATTALTGLTNARGGQYFFISIDGDPPTRIELDDDDSLGYFEFKVQKVLGQHGVIDFDEDIDHRAFTIQAQNNARIEITGGPEGYDALAPLGLRETILYGDPPEGEEEDGSIFEMGFFDSLDVTTAQGAFDANVIVENAMKELRDMFEFITLGPEDERKTGQVPISSENADKIAQMNGALAFITGMVQANAAAEESRQTGGNGYGMLNLIV